VTPIRTLLALCALVLVTATAGSAATPTSAVLSYVGIGGDQVGPTYNASPDGIPDGHFRLYVTTTVSRNISSIELNSQTGGVWDTVPKGSWAVMAVVQNGKRLNPNDEGIAIALNGSVTLDLYAHEYGYFANPTSKFVATITFTDLGKVTSTIGPIPTATAPAAPTSTTPTKATTPPAAKPPATTASGPPELAPNKTKAIPDFWVGLSASVTTRGTLGLGGDLALTASPASNNQVLTVTVFERATGCLIEGTWVELWGPDGKIWQPPGAVRRTRYQAQAGLVYMGGLKLREAGLYHLWVYAQDAAGKVVMEAYLPLQVKDRHGVAFETLNGRPFTYEGGEWVEGTRTTSSALSAGNSRSAAGNPFAGLASAFQQLWSGIATSAQRLFLPGQKTEAKAASDILNDPAITAAARIQKVQRVTKAHVVPSYLLNGSLQSTAPHAAATSPGKVTLIGQDGTSLIGQDGTSLIGQDGTSLITNDGGRLVAAGGNILATDGATIVATDGATARSLNAATANTVGACAGGYKKVGAGTVKVINGSPVLANSAGKIVPGTLVIGGRNAMPINGPAS
jgi:hypothetical protein